MATETAMAQHDVNAVFASQKLDQLATVRERQEWLKAEEAKGNLRLQGDRYVVLSGWDRGETFSAKTTKPEHGLDLTESGDVALYLKDRPAWHGLGTVIKGGSSSVDTVLKAAGLDWETLVYPTVNLLPIPGTDMEDGLGPSMVEKTVPDTFTNYRSDTLEPLGTVGKIYKPVHNRQAFAFLEGLFGDHLMIAESAGSMRGGRKVFISAELPRELIIDPNGIADHIRMFAMMVNSHDGKSPFKVVVTPWRPVCKNTERLAVANAVYSWSWRHTTNTMNKIQQAQQTLNLTTQYYDAFQEEEEALLTVPFSGNEIDDLIHDVWECKVPDAETSNKERAEYRKRQDAVHDLYRVESESVGRNAYAAERAVTGYVDHFADLRPRGALKGNRLAAQGQAILEESNDGRKNRAHKKLMTLVNR